MSHAPVETSDYEGSELAYAKATIELNRQVDEGTPWSGSERNQVFLNLGKKIGKDHSAEFADISAVAGFDFPDDSRGLTALDWDLDGDLDIITTNRTAPRLRIFENQFQKAEDSSLLIKLIGSKSNRDAIGSRAALHLTLADQSTTTIHRTLTAGHGFLSQASKWIHFGLPTGSQITSLEVYWNGKTKETFEKIAAGKSFTLTEGSGAATPWTPPFQAKIPPDSNQQLPPHSPISIAHLERPLPLPEIPCLDASGQEISLTFPLEKPILLNLWATWCPDCLSELSDFAKHASHFEKAGVQLVTLCVDIEPDDPEGRLKALEILKEKNLSSRPLFAAPDTLELIHLCHNVHFIRPSQLPAPSSLLITKDGQLRSVFRGPAEPNKLIKALEALTLHDDDWKTFAAPGEGPWAYRPDLLPYSEIAKEMLDRDWLQRAGNFLLKQKNNLLADGQKYPELLMLTGTRFLENDLTEKGILLLEAAVQAAPDLAAARNNLAVALLKSSRSAQAVPHLKAAIKSDPSFIDPKMNLAQFYVDSGNEQAAIALILPIIENRYLPKAMQILAQIHLRRKELPQLAQVFQIITQNEPENPTAWLNLGKLQHQLGKSAEALTSYQKANQLSPGNPQLESLIKQLLLKD